MDDRKLTGVDWICLLLTGVAIVYWLFRLGSY